MLFLLPFFVQSQENFKWDIITDSLDQSKSEIFAKVKESLASVSSPYKLLLEDSESGVIKVICIQKITNGNYYAYFKYETKYMVKDNKLRVVTGTIYCSKASKYPYPKPSEIYPGKKACSLKEDQYYAVMNSLKSMINLKIKLNISAVKKEDSDW
mgnify:CR=1 FL=1